VERPGLARGLETASDRLHATNNFPEFTGRLCPAPCESACVVAINREAVTIKNVEVSIIDRAWEQGTVHPQVPSRLTGRTVAVVGSGPGRAGRGPAAHPRGPHRRGVRAGGRPGGLLRYGIPEFKMEKRHLDRRIAQMTAEGTRFRSASTSAARGSPARTCAAGTTPSSSRRARPRGATCPCRAATSTA
jgi:glutamate synthase (NADPH/NADH) small chain